MKKRQAGTIVYLDPADKGLSNLVGEISAENGSIYLFRCNPADKLQLGGKVEFELNRKSGMAVKVRSKSLAYFDYAEHQESAMLHAVKHAVKMLKKHGSRLTPAQIRKAGLEAASRYALKQLKKKKK